MLPTLAPSIATIGCGIVFGLVVLTASQQPTRWLVYMLAGTFFAVVTLVGHVRRQLVIYFIVGLSLNVHYYLTQPEPVSFIGNSSPTYFSIPLVLFPAGLLALRTILDAIAGRTKLRWGLRVGKLGALVIATAIISAMFSSVRRYGIYAVVEMLQFLFIYIVTVNVVRSKYDLSLVIQLLLITLLIQCAVFCVQTISGTQFTMTGQIVRSGDTGLLRASGTVGVTSSGYAIFVEPLVFTAFALWRIRDSGASRVWTGFLTALGAVTLILTDNRTSWLTLLIGVSLVEFLCRARSIARPLSGKVLLSAGTIFVVSVMMMLPLILPRLHAAHGDDWQTRKDLMRIAIRMIAGNPIVGVGPGAYPFRLREYIPNDVGNWLWVVHNEYLLVWAERGLLGFLVWLAWIRSGLRQAILATTVKARQFQAFGIGCVAGIVGLLWEYVLNVYPPYSCYALLWCLFGVLVAGNDIYGREEIPEPSRLDDRRLQLNEVSVGR